MNSRNASFLRTASRLAVVASLMLAIALPAAQVVLLISLDGFRRDYPGTHPSPAIRPPARLTPAANEGDDRLARWLLEGETP